MRNIELKARLSDSEFEAARQLARAVATRRLGTQHQVDTYFRCRFGRLKLREVDGQPAQLVSYTRPDEPGPRPSDYLLVPVAEPELLKAALAAALGVRCVVEKRREISLYHNVRIHLDEVKELGQFLEFEAVIGPEDDEPMGRRRLDDLVRQFSLAPGQLCPQSYADMLS